ncbi:DNA-directed RNA polymerase, mitochondrial [Planococcus citri]|uniref:DNA-directed RNA polymerase, mitochondrial n=1 Tax=Planococcus citri TaxID=170843 RepID=UPI0031F7B90D
MYRLLKVASVQVSGSKLPKLKFNQPSLFPCSLCNRDVILSGKPHNSNKFFTRTLTTSELASLRAIIKKRKKIKKPKKKYAELVEINEDSSKTTKAVVKNLTARQISKLTEQPDSSLKYLHNAVKPASVLLPEPAETAETTSVAVPNPPNQPDEYPALFNPANLFPLKDDFFEQEIEKELEWELIQRNKEDVEMIPEISFLKDLDETKTSEASSKQNVLEKIKSKAKSVKNPEAAEKVKQLKEQEIQFIIEKFNINLTSYIDLCVHCDYLNIGFGTLSRYTNKNINKKIFQIRSARPFNSLMHGYAKKGNVEKVMELLRMMRHTGVSPNPQSYAAAFETFGRLPEDENNIAKLQFLHQDMKSKSFDFQHLFDHCTYLGDQREHVLKAVRRLDADFVPHYHPPMLHYNCSLLNELNKPSGKKYKSPCRELVNDEQMENYIQEQLKIELSSPMKIKSVVALSELTDEIKQYRAKWRELEDMWRMSIREALQRDLELMKIQQNSTKSCYGINIYPYLKALTHEQFVDIILQEIRRLVQGSETFSPNLRVLYKQLGHQVRLKYQIKHRQQHGIMDKIENVYKNYCKWYLNPELNSKSLNTRHQWQNLLHSTASEGASLDDKEELWPPGVVHEIGKFLYNIIIKDVKTDVNCLKQNSTPEYLPAFYSLFRYQGHMLLEELKPHPQLARLYKEMVSDDLFFDVNMLPMVSPPVPWTSVNNGGYVLAKADFIRLHYGVSSKVVEEAAPQRLYPVFDSLNQLGSIPWKINESVLDVVLEVFRKGGSTRLDIPLHVSAFTNTNASLDSSQKSLTYQERAAQSRRKAEMFGLWCEALYRLSLANHFRKRVFWLPHNMDFRGRVYPVPPHLTHLGNDMARSLLVFARGEKLGPKGLDWLKIHCINLTGLKKREPLSERLRYAEEILADILDSAENPLTGKMWWADSEEQWQTLACCMEIKKAIDSGDPENYISHFPVHQDGSCNGLQHYAALGRDQAGAESVNLVPCTIPQDVYSCVVTLVERERLKDAANGSEIAIALEGFIKRKVIKQTIMTTVYGVTRYGARLQIAKQLKDIDSFPKNLVWGASTYLTSKTFHCLQEMFTSSREIQNWLTDSAKFISGTCGKNIEWLTPLGLPVMQPYSKKRVSHLLNDKNGKLSQVSLDVVLKPNAVKQKNAFPPNFVHSLDSSHMMLTSLFCERENITFVSVHDCFWTHPCTVDVMNEICRKQFVALHSEPILENLSAYLLRKFHNSYPYMPEYGCKLPHEVLAKVPGKGKFDLQSILQSTYFFS